MKILTGNSNRPLAEAISAYLNLPLTKAAMRRFSDMEVFVEIHENVRGEDVFVIQSTSYPANDNLMELLVAIDALKRGSARRITAVLPYYGYARQDRKSGPRTPISAKLVANLITEAGYQRVLALDLSKIVSDLRRVGIRVICTRVIGLCIDRRGGVGRCVHVAGVGAAPAVRLPAVDVDVRVGLGVSRHARVRDVGVRLGATAVVNHATVGLVGSVSVARVAGGGGE